MAGIPLIAAEGVVVEDGAAEDVEGGAVETGHNGEAKQGAEAAHDEGVERIVPSEENPASDAECVAWLSMLRPRLIPPL
jgi:hypothetical protein